MNGREQRSLPGNYVLEIAGPRPAGSCGTVIGCDARLAAYPHCTVRVSVVECDTLPDAAATVMV